MDVEEAHAQVLEAARNVVAELERVDPNSLTRHEWETELDAYLDALHMFEETEPQLYRSIYNETSAKGCLREYFRDNLEKPVSSQRLGRVSGISEYARRVRELRNEEGFVVDTARTRSNLCSDEYLPLEIRPEAEEKSRISAQQRYEQLSEQSTCEVCGRGVGDGSVKWMEVDHKTAYINCDPEEANNSENLQTLCNECHSGKTASEGINNRTC